MKIGVISDTHIPKRGTSIPTTVLEGLRGVELIIHVGDWQDMSVYQQLTQIAPVEGVAGNVDDEEIKQKFGKRKVLSLNGFEIGVVHGDGKGKTTLKRVTESFSGQPLDLILFGHSHIPYHQKHNGVIYFNPGSPTDKRRQQQFSYGILSLEKKIRAELIFFDKDK
ncbi:metallophosphoesterase family protein [Litchfieldia alkalitelluris]|uniref:metallophosphoesterase family protein n=1 Tax=Litchfieldia alkalitelluris TaxID=304268 RepID=UPI000996D8DB|nr:metallophosphoesterase family protein [Litchfieldia alkalitelluris]